MLRWSIIIGAVIVIPVVVVLALRHGSLQEVTFAQAIQIATSSTEGDTAPKVIVRATIESEHFEHEKEGTCVGDDGTSFQVSYTGGAPDVPLTAGATVKFVGHVHGGPTPTFHATQVYAP